MMVRLAGNYCNREADTAHLRRLIEEAHQSDVHRAAPAAVERRRAPKKLSSSQNNAIVAAYESGQRIIDIAEMVGVTAWTVNYRLKQAGIARRSLSMPLDAINRAVQLRGAGMSVKKIGIALHYAQGTVAKELRSRGAW